MNPLTMLGTLFSFFTKSEAGAKVGGGLSTGVTIAALIPVGIGLYKWFEGHKADIAFTFSFTWGEAIFLGLVAFAVVEIIRAVHPRAQ